MALWYSPSCRGVAWIRAMAEREDDHIIDFGKLIPQPGMAVTVINRGSVYQIITHYLVETPTMPMLQLTDDDIIALSRGEITFQ